jgi:putative iron-dependent peroxidase
VGEFGTYFIGYAHSPDVIEQMLQNMFTGKPEGNYDRILDFSTATTGSLFFVPSAEFMDDPPGPSPVAVAETSAPSPVAVADNGEEPDTVSAAATDGSLAIGSLREDGS